MPTNTTLDSLCPVAGDEHDMTAGFDGLVDGRSRPFVDDVTAMAGEQLEQELRTLSGHLAAAHARFLTLVGEFDERKLWSDWESLSCAHWLSWRCGVGLAAAREQVRVARCLRELPTVAAVFAEGGLSYSKVRAITRVANEDSESAWIGLARAAPAGLLDIAVRRWRRARNVAVDESLLVDEEDAGRQCRSLTWYSDHNGDLIVRALVPAVDAPAFAAAIESRLVRRAAEGEVLEAFDVRRLDALMDSINAAAAVESSLAIQPTLNVHLTVPIAVDGVAGQRHPTGRARPEGPMDPLGSDSSQGPAASSAETEPSPSRAAPDESTSGCSTGLAVARLERAVLSSLSAPSGWPILDGRGRPRSLAWLGEVLDDAALKIVVDLIAAGSGELLSSLDVGREARQPNRSLRRSVMRRDQGRCRFPGCTRQHRLNVHHIVFWEHGGRTDAENLIVLCPAHHAAIHQRGWSIVGTASTAEFRRGDGQVADQESPPMSGVLAKLVDDHRRYGLDIAADGAGSHWAGDNIEWASFSAAFAEGPLAAHPTVEERISASDAAERERQSAERSSRRVRQRRTDSPAVAPSIRPG